MKDKKLIINLILVMIFLTSITLSGIQYDYTSVEINTYTFNNHPIGYAHGQKENGTIFTSEGGFTWQDHTQTNMVSFYIDDQEVLLPLSSGSVIDEENGIRLKSPYINEYCKVYTYKDILIKCIDHYRRFKFSNTSQWKFYRREYLVVELGSTPIVEKYPKE